MGITPNVDQFAEYANSDLEGEVVMLNLLAFKPRAEGEEGSGQDAYRRYSDSVVSMVEAQGGRVLWMGSARHVFIGDPEGDQWDAVALVSYPNRQAFLDMISTDDYGKAHEHREAGLARTVLIACKPAPGFETA